MMAISETKMQIVIANYFKDECDVNTSIRQAFEKGFRIGVKKAPYETMPIWIPWEEKLPEEKWQKYIIYYRDCHNDCYDIDVDAYCYNAQDGWEFEFYNEPNFEIIAWMPLPAPYKGD